MKNCLFILLFSIIEYFITLIITNNINIINYDTTSLNYTSFKFSTNNESPTGLNTLIKLFLPSIYIIILSGILYNLKQNELVNNIYLVSIAYYIFKWIICIFILNRGALINWGNELTCFIISSLLSFILYHIFISKTTQIFISTEEIRDGIWIGIITFFLSIIIKTIYARSYLNLEKHNEKKEKYLTKHYLKLKSKYKNIIRSKNNNIKYLTYAIMIYENYNRPTIIRMIEYIKFFVTGKASLGIMQVTTEKYINNKKSVELGYEIIENTYSSIKRTSDIEEKIKKVIFVYNKSDKYVEEVLDIYYFLKNNFK